MTKEIQDIYQGGYYNKQQKYYNKLYYLKNWLILFLLIFNTINKNKIMMVSLKQDFIHACIDDIIDLAKEIYCKNPININDIISLTIISE